MLKNREPVGLTPARQSRAGPGAVASVSAKLLLLLLKFCLLYLLTTPTVSILV